MLQLMTIELFLTAYFLNSYIFISCNRR